MIQYRKAKTKDLSEILEIWERSVKATHHFLTEKNIVDMKEELRTIIPKIEVILAIDSDRKEILGFSSVADHNLNMLFLDDKAIGQGVGSQFFDYMLRHYPFSRLDVNKDNPDAFAFYLRKGFKVIEEKERDDEGRPFPILVMEK